MGDLRGERAGRRSRRPGRWECGTGLPDRPGRGPGRPSRSGWLVSRATANWSRVDASDPQPFQSLGHGHKTGQGAPGARQPAALGVVEIRDDRRFETFRARTRFDRGRGRLGRRRQPGLDHRLGDPKSHGRGDVAKTHRPADGHDRPQTGRVEGAGTDAVNRQIARARGPGSSRRLPVLESSESSTRRITKLQISPLNRRELQPALAQPAIEAEQAIDHGVRRGISTPRARCVPSLGAVNCAIKLARRSPAAHQRISGRSTVIAAPVHSSSHCRGVGRRPAGVHSSKTRSSLNCRSESWGNPPIGSPSTAVATAGAMPRATTESGSNTFVSWLNAIDSPTSQLNDPDSARLSPTVLPG